MIKPVTAFLPLLFLALISCSSSQEINGTVRNTVGEALSGILVRVIAISDAGVEQAEVAKTLTNSSGKFSLDTSADPGPSILVQAELSGGPLRTFAALSSPQDVDPLSDAFVTAILYVTETVGGRSLTDFTAEELQTMMKKLRDALAADSTVNQSDSTALINWVLSQVGRDIANAAGGSISGVALSTVAGPDLITNDQIVSAPVAQCPDPHVLLTAEFFRFDVLENGAVCNVEGVTGPIGNAFDNGSELSIFGDTFSGSERFPGDLGTNPGGGKPALLTEDGRELSFGPVTTDMGKIKVTRKVFIFSTSDVVRSLEVIENLTDSEVEVDIRVSGDFGLLTSGVLFAQSHPDRFDEKSDFGALIPTTLNDPKPTVGFVIDGPGGKDGVDSAKFPPQTNDTYQFNWNDIKIPAKTTVAYLHYVFVTSSQLEETVRSTLESIYNNPNMAGFSATELNSLANFIPSIGNITGEAGSVASNATVTFIVGSSTPINTTANRDGSFTAAVQAVAGDVVQITGSDGTSTSVTIP